ncbi:MAG: stalk domain-containing protein [Bacillota bacterium]
MEDEEEKEAEEDHEGLANRIAKLEAELADKPSDAQILWKLAVAYRAAGEYDKAIEVLKELGKLSPKGAKVAVMLALCLRAKGYAQAALTELEGLGATVPGAVYGYRAILKEELGELEEAVEDMEGAVSGEPAQKDLYEKLGGLYEKAGKGEGVKVFVKGKKVSFDVQPMIVHNRTMVPVRAIAEALGAEVRWDGETRTVTVLKAGRVVLIPIGSLKARVDGAEVALDVPAVIVGDRTLIPLRFVSESLGALVDWFGTGQVVAIN